MLPARRVAFGNLDIHGSEPDEPAGPEDGPPDEEEADHEVVDLDENPEGPPSKRLRLRKGTPEQTESGEDISDGEELSDSDKPPLRNDSSDASEDELPHTTHNSTATRARRAAEARAMDDDDPLQDTGAPVRAAAPPVHQDLHLLDLSVTLSKSKGHINPAWLTLVHEWMKHRVGCVSGAAAQERGGKAQHLHLQIMLRMRIAPMDIDALKIELKSLVGWQRGDDSGCYCQAKEFGVGQASQHLIPPIFRHAHCELSSVSLYVRHRNRHG